MPFSEIFSKWKMCDGIHKSRQEGMQEYINQILLFSM